MKKRISLSGILILALILALSSYVLGAKLFNARNPMATETLEMNVYNNTGVQLLEGDVVIWDTANIANAYVSKCIAAIDDVKVAGVVKDTIDTNEVGAIILWGWAEVKFAASQGDTTTIGGLMIKTSTTAGLADITSSTGAYLALNEASFGHTIDALGTNAATKITCFVNVFKAQ